MPKFRRVTGLFRAAIPDGPDSDYTPELEALNGQVEFIPRYRGGVIAYPRLEPPEFVRPEPIQAILQDGRVMTQVSVGEETTVQPVELMVSDDDEATQSWQWEAVFRDIRVGRWGDEVSISPLRFTVPDEHGPLDLTEVVGEKSGGTITVKGPRGEGITDLRAENGELIVEWGAGKQLTIPVPEAVPGPKGDKGEDSTVPGPPGTVDLIGGSATITVSKQVGTSVSIGDVRVHYESGARNVASLFSDINLSSGGTVTLTRHGRMVIFEIYDAQFSTASGTTTLTGRLPVGFRPATRFSSWAGVVATSGSVRQVRIDMYGSITVYGLASTDWLRVVCTYFTNDGPPVSLPGTAA